MCGFASFTSSYIWVAWSRSRAWQSSEKWNKKRKNRNGIRFSRFSFFPYIFLFANWQLMWANNLNKSVHSKCEMRWKDKFSHAGEKSKCSSILSLHFSKCEQIDLSAWRYSISYVELFFRLVFFDIEWCASQRRTEDLANKEDEEKRAAHTKNCSSSIVCKHFSTRWINSERGRAYSHSYIQSIHFASLHCLHAHMCWTHQMQWQDWWKRWLSFSLIFLCLIRFWLIWMYIMNLAAPI